MTVDQPAAVRALYEAYQRRSFESASAAFADDAEIANVATGDVYRGPQGYLQYARAWAAAFPDLRVEVIRYQATASFAVVEYAFRGTHTGALISGGGFVPATRSQIDLSLCDSVQMREGRITRLHTYFDSATLLRQMGLFPHSPLHAADRRAPLELYATQVDAAAQQRHKAIVQRFLEEVLSQRNPAAAAAVCAPDIVWHGGSMGDAHNLPSLQNKLRAIFRSFPDLTLEIHDVIAENDRVAVRLTLRGTQRGFFQGMPPSGREIESSAMNTYRIARNRIVEEWWQHDLEAVLKQVQSAPPPPSS